MSKKISVPHGKQVWIVEGPESPKHYSEIFLRTGRTYFGASSSGFSGRPGIIFETEEQALIALHQHYVDKGPKPSASEPKQEILVQPILAPGEGREIKPDRGEIEALPAVTLRDSYLPVWRDLSPEDVLGALFDDSDLSKVDESVHQFSDLKGSLKLYSKVGINPCHTRRDAQPSERKFIAAKFPAHLSADAQWRRIHGLSVALPLRLAVWTAHNLTIEAIYDARAASHEQLEKFAKLALILGCDSSALRASHQIPMPGNVSKNPAGGAFSKLREAGISTDSNATRARNWVLFYKP